MATTGTINVGPFQIGPQSGTAGEHVIAHKLTEQNTGRNQIQKVIRASISNPGADASALETLTVAPTAPFLTLDTSSADVAYNATEKIINAVSNAEKFRVSTTETGKNFTLKSNTGYTVSGLVGTFSTGFGLVAQGGVSILVGFSANVTASTVSIPVLVEYWDGEEWQEAGTFTITQATSDSTVSFAIDPSTLAAFVKAGEKKTVSVQSNIGYTIEKQGSSDVAWATLSRSTGSAGTADLDITASAQAVGSSIRNMNIIFKSAVTSSVIGQLSISQAAGDAFAISWANSSISFVNSEVGTVKNNTLTSNAGWQIEEAV